MSKPVLEDVLRFSGRRNRNSYVLYLLTLFAALIVMWGVAAAMAFDKSWSGLVVAGLATLPMIVSAWAVGAQRCRDFGWSGWAMLITVIPYVGWIFSLAILFIPGTDGPNRYGPDPIGARVLSYQSL
jgi:uncharacterized membrane protein YhaH (DUF805 family)